MDYGNGKRNYFENYRNLLLNGIDPERKLDYGNGKRNHFENYQNLILLNGTKPERKLEYGNGKRDNFENYQNLTVNGIDPERNMDNKIWITELI